MAFLESPRFPDNIAFGATVGPAYMTVVTPVYSGREARAIAWTQSRCNFEVGRRLMSVADTAAIDAFFRVVKGRAYGFRIKDWTDYSVTTATGFLAATATPGVFQLSKGYASGALTETRSITKPVVGTVQLYRNAAPVSAGGGAGQYALDTTTGLVTFVADASQNMTGNTPGSVTVLHFGSALTGAAVGKYVGVSGVSGSLGTTLNGKLWQITAVGTNQITIAANTTGNTGSGGAAKLYPQGTDVLTWSGQFDVPVRFDIDEMKKQIVERSGSNGELLVDWGSVPIIEIRV
ncbi:DUF2460 domain-containing protein [Cupriavidus necator]